MTSRLPRLLALPTSLALLLSLATPVFAGGGVPDAYQESYALETAYSYERALARLDGIPATGADAYLLPLRRGWLLYLLGRYDESVAAYSQAMKAAPDAVEARLGLTLPLMAQREWAKAEAECREVLEVVPGNYLAQSRLAYVLYNAGRFAEAEDAYAELVALYPSDVDMRSGLAWAQLRQGKRADAKANLEYVLHLAPDHSSAQEGLAAL